MASDDELEDFEEGWPERLPTCAAKCFLFVFEDERMTCLDFGHHSCLCRPIRMTSDADSLFNDCMYHYCVTEDVKDYSNNVMGYCLEVEAEERNNSTAETTTSTSMPSIPDVTESEHPTTSTTDPEPTTLAPSEPSNPSEPSEPSEAKVSETNGLSAGAKGGIAAGVVLGVAALILLAFFLFRRHRKKPLAAQESAAAGSEKGDNSGPAELGGGAVLPDIRKNTTDDPYIAELDVGPATQIYPERFSELDGMSIPRGLPVPEDTGGGTAVVKSSDGPTPH